jgi:transposase
MRDPEVDLWAEDEVHFQQHGSRCRMWIAPEIADPVVWHEPTRKSVGYFGAVRLCDGKLVYRREDHKFNAESFLEFLKQLKLSACRSGRRVIVVLDNAPYHHGKFHKEWRELHCEQFQLDFLPPYSPELNPIERVWKLTRRKCLHNVHFQQLSELTHAVENQLTIWSKPNQPLRLLCAIT